ncbi:MAG: DUF2007 domain-containing protein, partial [Acidimicrobiia bacterium]|nr:DUF2007 domain-containing protein [Acidimicrobiia bacterium]
MEPVQVATFGSTFEADLAAAALRSAGIQARVLTDTAGGQEPQLALLGRIRLLVPATDEEDARALLDIPARAADEPPLPRSDRAWAKEVAFWLVVVIVVGGLINVGYVVVRALSS